MYFSFRKLCNKLFNVKCIILNLPLISRMNYTCRDTIFNDPRMTLGSYVKGLNNMICREWVWKGMPLVAGQRSGPDFMRAHTKIGLACIAKPYIDVV